MAGEIDEDLLDLLLGVEELPRVEVFYRLDEQAVDGSVVGAWSWAMMSPRSISSSSRLAGD